MTLIKFRRLIDTHFNNEELRTLCFDLEVDYESLGGEGKMGKIRELIAHMKRFHRIEELLKYLRTERPNVSWPDIRITSEQENAGEFVGERYENPIRVAAWNALHRTLWTKKSFLHSYKGKPPLIEKFSANLWADFVNKPIDSRPDEMTQILQEIRGCFFSYEETKWRAFLEYILNYWNDLNHYKPSPINQAVNAALEREDSTLRYTPHYAHNRFVKGGLVEVSSTSASETFSPPAIGDSRTTATLDIPDNILKTIYQQAEKRYPDNFSMQKYVIEKEMQAWRDLHQK
jgi:hypothetical protein